MVRRFKLTCVIQKEDGVFTSVCPELNVASFGDTPEEARKNLEEAVKGHLQVAKEEGMLDELLENKARVTPLSLSIE